MRVATVLAFALGVVAQPQPTLYSAPAQYDPQSFGQSSNQGYDAQAYNAQGQGYQAYDFQGTQPGDVQGQGYQAYDFQNDAQAFGQGYDAYDAQGLGQAYDTQGLGQAYDAQGLGQAYDAQGLGQAYDAQTLGQAYNVQGPAAQAYNAQALGAQAYNAQALGAQAYNAQALGAQAYNAQALGAQAYNAQALGAQAYPAQALGAQAYNAQAPGAQAYNPQASGAQAGAPRAAAFDVQQYQTVSPQQVIGQQAGRYGSEFGIASQTPQQSQPAPRTQLNGQRGARVPAAAISASPNSAFVAAPSGIVRGPVRPENFVVSSRPYSSHYVWNLGQVGFGPAQVRSQAGSLGFWNNYGRGFGTPGIGRFGGAFLNGQNQGQFGLVNAPVNTP